MRKAPDRVWQTLDASNQVEKIVGLALDVGPRVIELLPHHEHHEREQHGIDRPQRLQVISDRVARILDERQGDPASHEPQPQKRAQKRDADPRGNRT
jgi:hypothetical protein